MANRNIPHNLEAEMSILGCVLLDDLIMKSMGDQIEEIDFFDERNKIIFNAMYYLSQEGEKIDLTTLSNELIKKAQYGNAGGIDYLSTLVDFVPTTSNIDSYISIVKDQSLKRKVIHAANEITNAGYDGTRSSKEYIDFAERIMQEVSKQRQTSTFRKIDEVTEDVKALAEETRHNTRGITGLSTGFSNLDAQTLGLQRESLIILAARPAMGKSAFAMNIATQVASKNEDGKARVAIFSLEMGADQLVSRMLACEANIEQDKIKKGTMNASEWRSFEVAAFKLMNLNIYFDDASAITVNEIRAKCRKLYNDSGLDLVVIDYLQLIKGDGRTNNRQEEVSNISRSLKQLARELKIPIIALSQLSREVEKREDKRPIMADLRESGSIEQDADIVMFLYRDDYYLKDKSTKPGEADLIIGKNRSGAISTMRYMFSGAHSRFSAKADDYYEPQD